MKRQDFRLMQRMRVRWAEVDAQKIVFNGHYLMYFDTAMADYWRELAFPYMEAMPGQDGDMYVKKATLEYHASAHYDEQIDVGLRCARIGTSSVQFLGGIFRGDQLLISGELVYVFADPATQTSRPLPQALRDLFLGYEDGQPSVRVRSGSWATLGADAAAIRTRVFIEEQGIPNELEWDEADNSALHAVAYNRLGLAVATGRLLQHEAGVGRIGRMAVHQALRGSNLGRDILTALLAAARTRGDAEVMLHAQTSAQGFYSRLGFLPRGPRFDEVGIAHQEMFIRLDGPGAPRLPGDLKVAD
jgi:YbgC/YbaW family acyl-CoA thioester hydrolase